MELANGQLCASRIVPHCTLLCWSTVDVALGCLLATIQLFKKKIVPKDLIEPAHTNSFILYIIFCVQSM